MILLVWLTLERAAATSTGAERKMRRRSNDCFRPSGSSRAYSSSQHFEPLAGPRVCQREKPLGRMHAHSGSAHGAPRPCLRVGDYDYCANRSVTQFSDDPVTGTNPDTLTLTLMLAALVASGHAVPSDFTEAERNGIAEGFAEKLAYSGA